jgi:hypothetical protein
LILAYGICSFVIATKEFYGKKVPVLSRLFQQNGLNDEKGFVGRDEKGLGAIRCCIRSETGKTLLQEGNCIKRQRKLMY